MPEHPARPDDPAAGRPPETALNAVVRATGTYSCTVHLGGARLDGVPLLVASRSKAGGLPPRLPRRSRSAAWSAGRAITARIPRRRR
ncbi:hypothetical protein [Streptomyces sp. NPDC059990]|uniref:hypothetical protein n=1 Tax=Streptomyces sp. NPDC059990 TaxID=3347027 RepID=UPI003687126E